MRSLVVGTAGHIDHGKSTLVRALTGTDPDRLKEEKERGITIDLGFAHADLGGGVVASFIDVPGHERFVRNMLAGAHGIDAVALVVAADESVMPQTREHFDICRLLGVPRGLVVLTKCDSAPADLQALAEAEVRELVAGSFLEGAPLVRVSARNGAGLEALRDALRDLAAATPARPSEGPLVLPIDRAFTLRGFGTVVTGTIAGGTLAAGDEVELLPSGRRARVRGLHVHGAPVTAVSAGSRAAVNLASVELEEVERGDVLSQPSALRASAVLDVEVTLLEGARALQDGARVRAHVASAEVLGRVRLLGRRALAGGERAVAQLRLERQTVALRGQRLVLRSYSPAATIGGAVVIDPLPPRRRRGSSDAALLARLRDAAPAEAARAWLAEAGGAGLDAGVLRFRTGHAAGLDAELRSDPEVVLLGARTLVARTALEALGARARAALAAYHAEHPLRPAMPREELRTRAFAHAAAGAFERLLADREAQLKGVGDGVALAAHEVTLNPAEQGARDALVAAARSAGLEGIDPATAAGSSRDAARVARLLATEGVLQRVGEVLVHAEALQGLERDVRARWADGATLDVTGFKEMTGLSRKFVIPLLEYLDRVRVTRRSGASRVVLARVAR